MEIHGCLLYSNESRSLSHSTKSCLSELDLTKQNNRFAICMYKKQLNPNQSNMKTSCTVILPHGESALLKYSFFLCTLYYLT